jgi:hypothetical protein
MKHTINALRKCFLISLAFSVAIVSSVANSAEIEDYFFFESDWGEEIKVHIVGTDDAPEYVIHASTVNTAQELARQLVKATMERRNYRYEFNDCFDCQVSYLTINGTTNPLTITDAEQKPVQGPAVKPITPLAEKTKAMISSKMDLANKFFEAIAAAFGTRAVDSVLGKAVADQSTLTSALTVVVERDGRPILLCRQTAEGCMTLDDVLLTNFEKGGWGASYPYSNINGSAENALAHEIEEALHKISQLRYTCTITYTGIHGEQMVAQMVCFLSH